MKKLFIILLVMIFLVCLVLGSSAGGGIARLFETKPGATPADILSEIPKAAGVTVSPVSNPDQRTILIVIADDLAAPAPRLEGVWLLAYFPAKPKSYLFTLYPPRQPSDPKAAALASSFTVNQSLVPGETFNLSLKAYNFSWDGYILLDLPGIQSGIDWLGGIDIGGGKTSGQVIVQSAVHPWLDPSGALMYQHSIAAGMCAALPDLPDNVNIIDLFITLIPAHLSTDLDAQAIIADWKAAMTASEPPTCEFLDK